MAQIFSLRYAHPANSVPTTGWARDWRRQWFRHVGAVCDHADGAGLAAFYSTDRDPAARLALQAELEARPLGVAQVLAACREASEAFDRKIEASNQRSLTASTGEGRTS
jgi:hypothetical protein